MSAPQPWLINDSSHKRTVAGVLDQGGPDHILPHRVRAIDIGPRLDALGKGVEDIPALGVGKVALVARHDRVDVLHHRDVLGRRIVPALLQGFRRLWRLGCDLSFHRDADRERLLLVDLQNTGFDPHMGLGARSGAVVKREKA